MLDLKMRGIDEVLGYFSEELDRLEAEVSGTQGTLKRLEDFLASAGYIANRLDTMNDGENHR